MSPQVPRIRKINPRRATRVNTPKNGWVLVTLMTAGLVVVIWAVAGPALTSLFEQAIQRVSGL